MSDHEQTFRLVLLTGCVVVAPIVIYHRLKSRTFEKLDRRQEGLFILITLRVMGVATLLGFVTYLANPARMAWSAMPLPPWLRWAGVGLGLVAGALLVWTMRCLGPNLTDTVVTRKKHTLVTTGPYRWVRHPFYVAAALAYAANSLATASVFLFVTGGVVMLLLVIRTRKEEENLIARFGDRYRSYMQRTGRFLPKL